MGPTPLYPPFSVRCTSLMAMILFANQSSGVYSSHPTFTSQADELSVLSAVHSRRLFDKVVNPANYLIRRYLYWHSVSLSCTQITLPA